MRDTILALNGPNLNMLQARDAKTYGNLSLEDIMKLVEQEAGRLGYRFDWDQSNHVGDLIDWIQEACDEGSGVAGIVLNAGGPTHTDIGLRDTVEIAGRCGVPTVEVHLSNIHRREWFRRRSFLKKVCIAQVTGLKERSYLVGLQKLHRYLASHS